MATSDDLNITSANAEVILTVENLYSSGVKLEGFSTDGSWTVDDATVAEARMGVDGRLAAGYVPAPRNVTITLEANSPSLKVMQNILEAMQLNKTIYACNLQITIPSLKKEYQLSKGVMLQGHAIPDGKKVLDPTNWQFVFESCTSHSI